MRSRFKYIVIVSLFTFILPGCTKLVEVKSPVTSVNGGNVYERDETAAAVLTGIYISYSASPLRDGNSLSSLSAYCGLSADELTLFTDAGSSYLSYYTNALTDATFPNVWVNSYPVIFTINSAIEGLSATNHLTPEVKQHLMGEAKFLRAFYYFYLVNLYGDVPLVLTTNHKTNAVISRTASESVNDQIISDLQEADQLLADDYLAADVISTTPERVRPNRWAAKALLARVYLYAGKYTEAESTATAVIANAALYSLGSLPDVFHANSSEAIWQVQPVNIGWNTEEGRAFKLPESGPITRIPALSQRCHAQQF